MLHRLKTMQMKCQNWNTGYSGVHGAGDYIIYLMPLIYIRNQPVPCTGDAESDCDLWNRTSLHYAADTDLSDSPFHFGFQDSEYRTYEFYM